MRSTLAANCGALLLFLLAMSWIEFASANIDFTDFASNLVVKPGASLNVTWKMAGAINGTTDLADFSLILRAATGQRYTIQNAVHQAQLLLSIQIPSTATGGMHSLYAYYTGGLKGSFTRTNQFTLSGAVVTTTGSTATSTPGATSPEADTGIPAVALGGAIVGVVVVLLLTALVFFNRHRRRVATDTGSRSMDGNKEAGFTSSPGGYASLNQDKESLKKSPSSSGRLADGGMVSVPLNGGPAARPPRPDESPLSQQQFNPNSPTRNPFDNPDAVIPPTAMSPHQHQYQPPQLPYPLLSPFRDPSMADGMFDPSAGSYTNPYQQNRRDSVASEAESAYDPAHERTMNSDSPSITMRTVPLSHSPSGRSINSSRYPHNTTPQPQAQHQNPFMHDHELMAVTAAAAAAAPSPAQAHQQLQQSSGQPAYDSKSMSSASPKMKEIEMQNLETQQQPLPAAQQSINPTQFDDKAEFEEDDNVAVYNGYRDTIFGAYVHQGDDEDEEEGAPPIPAVPTLASNVGQQAPWVPTAGASVIQRKKSIKFTGVPPSGPIVLPSHEAAKEHQARRQERQQQREEEEQQQRSASDADTEEDGDYVDEDEDDIKMRLMMTEAAAVSSNSTNPNVNNVVGASSSTAAESSSNLESDSPFGGDFYQDVLAAVEKNVTTPSPTSPKSPQPPFGFKKPVMPPVPQSPPPPPPAPPATPAAPQPPPPQQFVQQQHIPAPQPQLLQPVNEQVFGAPSPRIAPKKAFPSPSSSPSPLPAPSPYQSDASNMF